VPDSTITNAFEFFEEEFLIGRLEFLKINNIRKVCLEPAHQAFKPTVHAIDIVGCDLQGAPGSWLAGDAMINPTACDSS